MAFFPRVGTELSAAANLRFLANPAKHNRPAIVHRFENGWREGRFRTPAGTLDFTVVFTGSDADTAVMIEFFDAFGVVEPFTITHPKYGTGNAYLVLESHEIQPWVNGSAQNWSRIEIPIEGAF